MYSGFKIIVNPITRKVKEKVRVVEELFKGNNLSYDIYFARASGDAEIMAKEFVREGWANFVVIGGDGTVSEVINGVHCDQGTAGDEFHLGIIPAGSANDLARDLGIPLDTTKACQRIIKGEYREIDLVLAEHDNVKRLMHTDAGSGLIFEALSALESRNMPGSWMYLMLGLRTLFRYKNKLAHYVIEGKEMEVNTTALVISCGAHYLGFKGFRPDARLDDGLFEVTILHDMNWREIMGAILDLIKGTLSKNPKVIFMQAKEVLVRSKNALGLCIDGEIRGSLPVKFSIKPRALKIFV